MSAIAPISDLFLERQEGLTHRDLMSLMEYPFFAISKQPVMETRSYDDGKVSIVVKPGHGGLATIWDKDILIFVASQLTRMVNEGLPVGPKVRFHAHDFFVSCGRSSGGRAYQDLVGALDRLQSTSIRTNIQTGNGQSERGFFSWIKSGRMSDRQMPNGKKVLGMVEVELEDWVFRQIVEDKSILQIAPEYFELASGFARRIYELARKHCGHQARWSIGLPRLAEKVGYSATERKYFKRYIEAVIQANDLPEFSIELTMAGDASNTLLTTTKGIRGIDGLKVTFVRRRQKVLDRRGERPLLAEKVTDRRIDPVLDNESGEDPVTGADFKALLDQLGKNIGSKA